MQVPKVETQEALPELPRELYGDLADFNPESHEFQEGLNAANQLAQELGYKTLGYNDIFPPEVVEPRTGYTSELVVPKGLRLDTKQVKERIPAFRSNKEMLNVDVHRLVTDMGNELQYCNLRPFMSGAVQSSEIRPQNKSKIDNSFYRDLKVAADNLPGRKNIVQGVQGVHYSRASQSTKARRYWMDITPDGKDNMRTFAIIGENPDDTNAQKAIYRQLFDLRM